MEAPVLQLSVFTEEFGENDARPAGPELAASLTSDFDGLSDDELLAVAADARRVASWAQARELAAIDVLHRRRLEAEENGDPDYRILDAHETVVQETSAALGITDHAAAELVRLAGRLHTTLSGTRRALETGHIDKPKALVLDELTLGLDPALIAHIEVAVLPTADQRSTGQLRRRIRNLIKRLAPEQLKQRKREGIQDRRLEVWDDDYSGTSGLSVSGLDPVRAHGTYNRITAAAHGIKADGDPRTLHQLRADLAQQLLNGHSLPEAIHHVQDTTCQADPTAHPGTAPLTPAASEAVARLAVPRVQPSARDVTSGVSTAVTGPPASGGKADAGSVIGTDISSAAPAAPGNSVAADSTPTGGPPVVATGGAVRERDVSSDASLPDAIAALIAEMADRELAVLRDQLKATGRGHALPFRIARAAHDLHDRLAGLREAWCRAHDPAHGRTVYRPSGSMRQAIEARHITCAFPTCNRRSGRCDLDHTIPWGRGTSCLCNLAPLCRKHHRAKQTPGWRLVQPWPGVLIWVTPSGNWHITLPNRE